MRPTDKIDFFVKNTLKTSASSELDQRMDTLIAQSKPTQTHSLNRWSIIMKSNITKYATAAIILIAVFLSLTVWNTTVSPAYAMEQIREAIDNKIWMHAIVDMKCQDDLSMEVWLSPSVGIDARLYENGRMSFSSTPMNETAIYDPNSNTLTYSAAAEYQLFKAASISAYIDLIIQSLNDNDHAVMTTSQEAEKIIYEIKIPKGDPPGSIGTEVWRLIVDKKNRLLRRMELEGWDETGKFMKVGDFKCDYPETGPMSIYELGVPQIADIVDKRPSEEVKQILDNYQTARSSDLNSFTAVELISRHSQKGNPSFTEANIWFIDHECLRKDNVWTQSDFVLDKNDNQFESLYSWYTNPEKTAPRMIELYDGNHYYLLSYNYSENKYRKPRKSTYFKRTPMSRFFFEDWAEIASFMELDQREPAITLIENEYSKQHGLICLQKLYDESGGTPQGRFYKRLCYLDPDKDYLCRRFESYLIQDAQWLEEYKDAEKYYVKNPDKALEFTQRQIKEIAQFGQTASGQWYPKEIQKRTTTQSNDTGVKDDLTIVKIYLDTEREIPADIFHPESFSNYLSE